MNQNRAAGESAPEGAKRCPSWCVTSHGRLTGEEDWLHVGAPLALSEDTAAQLCLSVDPETGSGDGPYVLIGVTECTLEEAGLIGASLVDLAGTGTEGATRPGAA